MSAAFNVRPGACQPPKFASLEPAAPAANHQFGFGARRPVLGYMHSRDLACFCSQLLFILAVDLIRFSLHRPHESFRTYFFIIKTHHPALCFLSSEFVVSLQYTVSIASVSSPQFHFPSTSALDPEAPPTPDYNLATGKKRMPPATVKRFWSLEYHVQ